MKPTNKTGASKQRDIEVEDLKKGWQRTQADFENYRRRVELEKQSWIDSARTDCFKEILPVLNNIDLAVAHQPKVGAQKQWVDGIIHIARQIEQTLDGLGIKKISPQSGETFDPNIHEAVRTEELANALAGTIIKTESVGYALGNKVITPAKVVVQK